MVLDLKAKPCRCLCPQDEVYIESVLLSRQLGVDGIIVLEQVTSSSSRSFLAQYVQRFSNMDLSQGSGCLLCYQMEELNLVVEVSKKFKIRPVLGIRAKLAVKHDGHWGESSGERGKFGLTVNEIVRVIYRLRQVCHPHPIPIALGRIAKYVAGLTAAIPCCRTTCLTVLSFCISTLGPRFLPSSLSKKPCVKPATYIVSLH